MIEYEFKKKKTIGFIDLEPKERVRASFEIIQTIGDLLNIYMAKTADFSLALALSKCLNSDQIMNLLKYVTYTHDDYPFKGIPIIGTIDEFDIKGTMRVIYDVLDFYGKTFEELEIDDLYEGMLHGITVEGYLEFLKDIDRIILGTDKDAKLYDSIQKLVEGLLTK